MPLLQFFRSSWNALIANFRTHPPSSGGMGNKFPVQYILPAVAKYYNLPSNYPLWALAREFITMGEKFNLIKTYFIAKCRQSDRRPRAQMHLSFYGRRAHWICPAMRASACICVCIYFATERATGDPLKNTNTFCQCDD